MYTTIPNALIGASFLMVPLACLWLYSHRYKDWPKASTLLQIGACFGMCAVSRLCHAFSNNPAEIAFFDWASAVVGLVCTPYIFMAVIALQKLPTPKKWEHTVRNAIEKKNAVAMAEWERTYRQRAERQRDTLLNVLNSVPNMPDELKVQVQLMVEDMPK